jgi:hypothetical protein
VSSFGGAEPIRLPFDLQRSPLFAAAVALAAMLVVAAGATLGALYAVGLVAAIALALAVALNPMLGLVLLAALAPAASGLARGLPVPGLRLSEALAGGIGVILIVAARERVRWTPVDWLALLYAAATLGLGAWNVLSRGDSITTDEFGLLVGPFQFLLLYRAVAVTATTPERRRIALRVLIVASVPVALLAIAQQINAPGARDLVVWLTGTDIYEGEAVPRTTGPFPHWHNLGGYLFMVLLAIGAVVIRRVPRVLPTPVLLAIGAVDAAALIETLSIAPIFGLVAGLLMIAVWLGGAARAMLGLAVAILVAALLFGPRLEARTEQQFSAKPGADSTLVPQTIQYRLDHWSSAVLPVLEGRWLTGYGPSPPPEIRHFPFTESQYINFLYRGGVILLGIWLALAAAMALAAASAARSRDPLQQALGACVATAVLCLSIMQLIQPYFVDSGTPHVLWVLLGLLAFREVEAQRRRTSGTGASATPDDWGRSVKGAFETLDPGSRTLLRLSYRDRLPDEEIVGVLGLGVDTIERWRTGAVRRIALRARLSPAEVERVLAGGVGRG